MLNRKNTIMKDWVFCNKCSLKFQPNVKFYLSECGHIFCEKCVDILKQAKTCPLCKKPSQIMELGKSMDSTTQMFFWPIENILQQSLQVFNFQTMHKNLFLQALNRKYQYVKKECIHYYNATKKLQRENQMMREFIKKAGYNPPPPFLTSTPADTSHQPYDSNLSMLSSIPFTPAQKSYYQGGKGGQYYLGANSVNSSTHDPSPVQTVPKGYPVPVHREAAMNPAAATPNFIDKLRRKPGYPVLGNPRK